MSVQLITQYYARVEPIIRYGTRGQYRFADCKETVIDLLRRVCTVSVETMKIVNEMPG